LLLLLLVAPRYLPLTMESEFQGHLGDVLPLILDGLSDEVNMGGVGYLGG
jgi:hypothetical protein